LIELKEKLQGFDLEYLEFSNTEKSGETAGFRNQYQLT
jgi:hypothetical protein